jgi:hypothetical protein
VSSVLGVRHRGPHTGLRPQGGPPVGQRGDELDLAHQRYVERLTGVMTGRVEDEADASTPTRSAPASDQPALEELH